MNIKKNKVKSKILLVIIIVIILIIALIVISLSFGKDNIFYKIIQGRERYNEDTNNDETQVNITTTTTEKLGKGILKILINIESNKEINNVIFPNEDGSTITVKTKKLKIAKDITVKVGEQYEVIVETIDGNVTNKKIEIEPSLENLVSIGDFVDYSVGNWTSSDIAMLGGIYSGKEIPKIKTKWGGFDETTSKDDSIYSTKYNGRLESIILK